MKPTFFLILLGLTACTAPAAKTDRETKAKSFEQGSGVVTQNGETPYVDGLLTPVVKDERSLREQDLERIGRRP